MLIIKCLQLEKDRPNIKFLEKSVESTIKNFDGSKKLKYNSEFQIKVGRLRENVFGYSKRFLLLLIKFFIVVIIGILFKIYFKRPEKLEHKKSA